jgi:hypothetical protein
VLRDRVKPAFNSVNPAIAMGISKMRGRATKKDAAGSGVNFASPLGNVLARYKDKTHNFNRQARQTERRLCRE